MELNSLSIKELVALYNQHAEKPVKSFASKAVAVARVEAILPAAPVAVVRTNRAANEPLVAELVEAVGTDAFLLADAAERMGVSIKEVYRRLNRVRYWHGRTAVKRPGTRLFKIDIPA